MANINDVQSRLASKTPPTAGGVRMQLSVKHHEYWRKNLFVTAILMAIWFVATFVEAWYARDLNNTTFLGFPLGFYMSAQGSLIIYVVIIWFYARYMNKLDLEYDVAEGDEK
jgi:putative solute:sodium symporter small subunit